MASRKGIEFGDIYKGCESGSFRDLTVQLQAAEADYSDFEFSNQNTEEKAGEDHESKTSVLKELPKSSLRRPEEDIDEDALRRILTSFLRKHKVGTVEAEKLEAVIDWSNRHGVHKLRVALLEEFGDDLFAKAPARSEIKMSSSSSSSSSRQSVLGKSTSAAKWKRSLFKVWSS